MSCFGASLAATLLGGTLASGQAAERRAPDVQKRGFVEQSVDTIASAVAQEYFDPAVGARAAALLRRHAAEGRFDGAASLDALAEGLTRDLYDVTSDQHLWVAVRAVSADPSDGEAPRESARETRARRVNHGVQRVEILAGNVGYLNLTHFYRVEEAGDTIAAAMRTLRRADALILDMRFNGGGSPGAVALLLGYLFDEPDLPLFEIAPRSGPSTMYTAPPDVPASDRNGSRPVYVLTASGTFSAGEGLAFLLQERQRAEVVGERTAGAANPGRPYRVSEHFEVTIPNGRLRSAVGGGNWERSGVQPDVAVAASDALRVAHARALRVLLPGTSPGPWRQTLEEALLELESPAADSDVQN